ncbi:hypothetical protein ACFL1I_07985 [Candidatus Omnitrophota bacterium]
MRKKLNMHIDVLPELLAPLPFYPYNKMLETFAANFKNVLWLFSEAAYARADKTLTALNAFIPNEHHSVLVKNYTYRGNIICGGLLMVQDFQKAITKSLRDFKKQKIKIDLLMLPQIAFDRYGDDLMGVNYSTLTEKFNIPIWLR